MFSLSKIGRIKVIAIFDISGGSIGGALFEQDGDSLINIITTTRSPVNFLMDVNLSAFLRCAHKSLTKVIAKLKKKYNGRIDGILIVYSSPWYVSQSKIINVTKNKPFEVRKDFFKLLIREEEKTMVAANNVFIEHEIVQVELNGYFTRRPFGKMVKSVRARAYLSAGEKRVLDLIKNELAKNFHAPAIVHTLPWVAFKIIDAIIDSREGHLIIDIGGETTEMLVIRNSSLEGSFSFPRGVNHLLRKISSATNSFFAETPSILKTYARGHKTMESSQKLIEAIKETSDDWCSWARKSMTEATKEYPLPRNVFLIGDDLAGKYFTPCLTKDEFSGFTTLRQPFDVRKLHPEWLAPYFKEKNTAIKEENESEPRQDVLLMMEMIFGNKIFNSNFII